MRMWLFIRNQAGMFFMHPSSGNVYRRLVWNFRRCLQNSIQVRWKQPDQSIDHYLYIFAEMTIILHCDGMII